MPDTLFVALGAIIGALIAGFSNYFQSKTQFFRQKELDEINFTRNKYEKIFEHLEALNTAYVDSITVIGQSLERNKKLNLSELEKIYISLNIKGRLKMLVALYANPLKDSLLAYYSLDAEYIKMVSDIGKNTDTSAETIKEKLEQLSMIHGEISKKITKIELELFGLSNELFEDKSKSKTKRSVVMNLLKDLSLCFKKHFK